MKITCPNCKKMIDVDEANIFCPNCGEIAHPDAIIRKKLGSMSSDAGGKVKPVKPVAAAKDPVNTPRRRDDWDGEDYHARFKKDKKSHKAVMILLCVLVIVCILTFKFFL